MIYYELLIVLENGLTYLKYEFYILRLNTAFPSWSLVPTSDPYCYKGIHSRSYALLVNDQFISEAFGYSTDISQVEYIALVRTCKDLLVASELWDPNTIHNQQK